MKWVEIELDGELYLVAAEKSGGKLWFHFDGQTHCFAPEVKQKGGRRGPVSGASASDRVKAPMPGKIIKVLVQEGDSVDSAQALVVMEAMKMEYTLKAPTKCTIKVLKIKEGDQVLLDQDLVVLEKEGSGG